MARPRSAPDLYLLGKVATLYYRQDQTQQQIADRLGISRPTISRLLQDALEQGIVQISVVPPRGTALELESRLEIRYRLSAVHVVDATGSTDVRQALGAAAAADVARIVHEGMTIGLAWGTTLNAMVHALAPMPTSGVQVVQTLGGIGRPDAEEYAADLVRRMASALRASSVLLPAPGIVASSAVREALESDPHVRAALEQLAHIDTLFVGIGSLASNTVLNDERSIPHGAFEELRRGGAVGDIALRFFDAAGRPVSSSLDDRLLGISLEQLRATRRVVAIAGGAEKLDAIRGALSTGVIDVLVIDLDTAERLLAA